MLSVRADTTPCRSNSVFDSLKLKEELVVGLQQKCPGALDVLCCSRERIIHLYPTSWASGTAAHTVEGLHSAVSCPGTWGGVARILGLLHQPKASRAWSHRKVCFRNAHTRSRPCVSEHCVFLSSLPGRAGRGGILVVAQNGLGCRGP